MPEFIRVRVKDSGTEQTIAKPSAIDPAAFEVLDEDAVDSNGRALPPKFPEKAGSSESTGNNLDAPGSVSVQFDKSGQQAATTKEK